MDTVEQAGATVEQAGATVEQAPAPQEPAPVTPNAPQDQAAVTQAQAPVTAESVTKEADTHKVCKNCGYHDASGKDAPRCPACNFRHDSQPVHQAPAKKEALAEDAAKADDNPAEEPSTQGETAEEPAAGDKSGEAQPVEDKPAEDKAAEEVVDGQAVRVVEKIVVVEKAPEAAQNAVQDAGKAVEEQG